MDYLKDVFLGGRGNQPAEYTELLLCRDVYHCLPSELARERGADIQRHLSMMNVEYKMRRPSYG